MMQTATGIGARDAADAARDRAIAQMELVRAALERGPKDEGKPLPPAGANEAATDPAKEELRGRLREVAQQFESVFLNILMSSMRKSVHKSELLSGGRGEEIFTGLFDQKVAEQASQRGDGLGISEMIFKQLEKSIRVKSEEDPSKRSADTTTGTSGGSTDPLAYAKKQYGTYRAAEGPKGKTVDLVVSGRDSRGNSGPLQRGGRIA